ncbi:DUF6461 domain-containing protein [Sphaerisporangium aureirubrum]|uniref:DUF6461 domain-containing protein n=1 Tax=Sphaerisporangium aureirubrum TaxID=1544736 RepID=A0ABW1NJW4_9ACTN
MMTEPSEGFEWLLEYGPLGDVYCVAFVRGCTPREVLERFGVDEETVEEMSFERFERVSSELAEALQGDSGGYVGAVEAGEWTVLVEPSGYRAARDRELLKWLCEGTEVVALNVNPYASEYFVHAADRDVVVSFEPVTPHERSGADPGRWDDAMREVGLGQRGYDEPPAGDPRAAAFALAGRITGVPFTRDILSRPFLAAVIATARGMV